MNKERIDCMAREIGLSRLTLFELEDQVKVTYGSALPVPWVVGVEVSKTISEYSAHADNVAEITGSKEIGAEISIEVSSDMPPKLESAIVGKKYLNGALVATVDDIKKQYGVAWETLMTDGNIRRYFYFNCSFSKDEQSNETISDSITTQTYSLTGKSIPLPITKEIMMVMDEREVKALVASNDPKKDNIQELWDNWFKVAPRPVE